MAIVGRIEDTVIIGLEEENIKRLKKDMPIHVNLIDNIGLPYTLIIFYGKDMETMKQYLSMMIGPDTVVIDERTRKKQ